MRNFFIIVVILFGSILSGHSQSKISYEQIAFEYYRDSIFKQYNLKHEITLSKKPVDEYIYWNVECLKELNRKVGDTVFGRFSDRKTVDLNIEKDSSFKIKKFSKKRLPTIFLTRVLSYESDQNIVSIIENLDGVLYTYLFEINSDGKIKKWCKDKLVID